MPKLSYRRSTGRMLSVQSEVSHELLRALQQHAKWVDAHQGYAKLLEEMDELKAEVWLKESKRDLKKMRREAIQVAAMAMRFALEVCGGE